MAKPAWQSLTIQSSIVGFTAGAVVTYMIVFVPPETKFKIGNLNFKPADVVSFLSTLGAVPASLLALVGRLKATGAVFTPHNIVGFDKDAALKIEAEHALQAAKAIGLPEQIIPQAVAAIRPTQSLRNITNDDLPDNIRLRTSDQNSDKPQMAVAEPLYVEGLDTIVIEPNTIAKQSTAQSSTLPLDKVVFLRGGSWSITKIENHPTDPNHVVVTFPQRIAGFFAWVVFRRDIVKGLPTAPIRIAPQSASGDVNLPVPYLTQLDNGVVRGRNIDLSSCNVTCAAMAARYYGIVGNGNGQLEVQMWEWLLDNGLDYGNADHIDRLIESYGLVDDFNPSATLADIDAALRAGYPVILQGWFTPSGHFVVGKGIQGDHYRIHDPVGLWDRRVRGGYNYDASGEDVLYSRKDIDAACNDNGIYLHVISRPKK